MENIFDQEFFLITNQENCISLFEKVETFEAFQMRMGLESLCQNTLVYPIGRDSDGHLVYDTHASPHSKKFYSTSCQKFCNASENLSRCQKMMMQISMYFCELRPIDEAEILDITLYSYDKADSKKNYMCYKCPFVHLYKCAFPIYVENTVVAVLFTGQFPVGISEKRLPFMRLKDPVSDSVPSVIFNRHFKNEESLMNFIKQDLLPVVLSFSKKAKENLLEQQEKILFEKIENQIIHMEEEITELLVGMNQSSNLEDIGTSAQICFWDIIANSLVPYLKTIGADEIFVFIEEQSPGKRENGAVHGIQLYPEIKYNCHLIFDLIQEKRSTNAIYTRDAKGKPINKDMFRHLMNRDVYYFVEQSDIVARLEKLQPFAILISYLPTAKIITRDFLRRKVLEHLESFFIKVGQELVHLSIHRSEQINKSVLRIYRHEIVHQIEVLNHNNLFLDIQKLKETDENKLRHVAEDQRQCIHELDFITHNINVFTGKVSRQSTDIDKNQLIDVSNDIINKAISLYQRAKRDKFLWFSVQNYGTSNTIKTNQSLLDMIFFNLMSNAIKYAYSGTKIIIGFDDTGVYGRPYTISLTDFGSPVEADYPNQVFQMYFRGDNASAQIEGSGIGLYVANEVANILGAKLTWECEKISDYNIPILMRYIYLLPKSLRLGLLSSPSHLVHEEYQRLKNNINIPLSQIFNVEYLKKPEDWSSLEIREELTCPTYRVTFKIEL